MLRYLFVDMNSFFASVEQQEQPGLRNRPIGIVPMMAHTTCCIAASYEAKAFGVKTGTMVQEARKLCPALQLVEARPRLYVEYHHRIVEAVESCLHVDLICSVDEMYGRLMGSERRPDHAATMAHQVKDAIRQAAGEYLRCSIGLAPNAWLAKVASDMQKPDGLTMILAEQMPDAICKLDLTDLPGIAANMQHRLHAHGVQHVHQLCRLSQNELAAIWGSQVVGSIWWHQLRGYDLPYRPTHRRTVGHSHVLPPDWRTLDRAHAVLIRMIHKAATRLRAIHYWAGNLTISLEYLDGQIWEERIALGLCQDTLSMIESLETVWHNRLTGKPYLAAVVLTHLVADASAALPLYPGQVRRNALSGVMDRIDRKYGHHTLYFGGMFGAQEAAPVRIAFTQIPSVEDF